MGRYGEIGTRKGIRGTARKPLTNAAVGVASVLMASSAMAQESQLPTIDVQADTGGGYQATNTGVTRIPTPLRDTPQTVNVVTKQLATEQGVRSMEDALRNVTGITFSAGEGGQQGDSPFIRGFTARGDIFRDGIRDPGWYTRDFFSVQSVEVYKGPSSFAFGRGSTGGAINNVSRVADGSSFAEATVTASTPSGVRTEMDVSGKASPNVAMRIQALAQNVDTADRDHVWTKRWGVAPSAVFNVSDTTKVTASYVYQGEEGIPDYGVPFYPTPSYSTTTGLPTGAGYNGNGTAVTPVQVPRNTFLGFTSGPFADVVQTDAHIATLKFDHEINAGTTLTNATRYMSVNRFAMPTAPRSLGLAGELGGTATTPPPGYPADQMTIGLQHWENITDNTMLINQTDIVSKFETGTLKHTLATGLEVSQETRHQQRANLCFQTSSSGTPVCRTNLVNPNPPGFNSTFPGWGGSQDTEMTNVGAYVSDQIKLNRWFEVMGSARFDQLHSSFTDMTQALPDNQKLTSNDGMFSWRVGAVFHPTEYSSIYYATGVSFNPSSELGTLSNTTVSLAPEETNSQEIGAKVDVLGGKLSLTGAWFHIEKSNMRVASDPTQSTLPQILDGVAVSEGFEFGVAGKLTDKWGLFMGYTVMNTELEKTTDMSQIGRRLPNAPPESFTSWTTYEITPKLTIGGGATYNSDTYANAQNTAYVPSYWKVDLMAMYKIDSKSSLQLNIYNLTDELYYAQYYGSQAVPAPGRWASLSYRIRW